jgi:hypothetical protein
MGIPECGFVVDDCAQGPQGDPTGADRCSDPGSRCLSHGRDVRRYRRQRYLDHGRRESLSHQSARR